MIDPAMAGALGRAQAAAFRGDSEEARTLYEELWTEATRTGDYYQACVTAHFLAHAHIEPEAQLDWHLRALRAANAVEDERICMFYPSLHGNLADVYLRLGDRMRAREHLALTRVAAPVLQDNDYWRTVIEGLIARLTQILGEDA